MSEVMQADGSTSILVDQCSHLRHLNSTALEFEVDVVDYNNDQKPTVAISTDQCSFFMKASDAERLGVYLIQAATVARQIEPGGPDDDFLPEDITNRLLSAYPHSVETLREAENRRYSIAPDPDDPAHDK